MVKFFESPGKSTWLDAGDTEYVNDGMAVGEIV
jgi:hypothetical protein